jgi:hypothetical protein
MSDGSLEKLILDLKESLEREIHSFRDQVISRFDVQANRLERHAMLWQTGRRWSAGMDEWRFLHRKKQMSEPAKLNPQFIKEPEVPLEDLKPGESAWVLFTEMVVDSEYRCYIDPEATTRENDLGALRATRTEAGFEVVIPAKCTWRWKLGAYNPEADQIYTRYLPVVKLEYEGAK